MSMQCIILAVLYVQDNLDTFAYFFIKKNIHVFTRHRLESYGPELSYSIRKNTLVAVEKRSKIAIKSFYELMPALDLFNRNIMCAS